MAGRKKGRAQSPLSSSRAYLKHLNKAKVSKDDVLEFVRETSALPKEDRGFESFAISSIRLHPGNPDKAEALMFRVQALARFLDGDLMKGWTHPEAADGARWTSEPVFAAAAVEPLVEVNNQLTFEPTSFKRKVLELADLEVEG